MPSLWLSPAYPLTHNICMHSHLLSPAALPQTRNVPEEWKVLFKAAGIKPRDLQEYATAK